MDFKSGDVVRIVDIDCNRLEHPTEKRKIKNGDVLTVLSVHLGTDDGTPTQMMVFTPGGDGIFSRRAELVTNFKVGDVVRIVDSGDILDHPTENRKIKNGDVLTIVGVCVGYENRNATQLLSFKDGDGGIFSRRVELVGNFKPGDVVRIVDLGGRTIHHPTEDRKIKNGDVLTVFATQDGKECNKYAQLITFIKDGIAIYSRRVELVTESVKLSENTPECKCPTLIHGHHTGCPWEK